MSPVRRQLSPGRRENPWKKSRGVVCLLGSNSISCGSFNTYIFCCFYVTALQYFERGMYAWKVFFIENSKKKLQQQMANWCFKKKKCVMYIEHRENLSWDLSATSVLLKLWKMDWSEHGERNRMEKGQTSSISSATGSFKILHIWGID